jgi:polysaccharide export outer membrane protein
MISPNRRRWLLEERRGDNRRLLTAALLTVLGFAVAHVSGAQPAAQNTLGPTGQIPPPSYRIGFGDILQIDVWKEPDASTPSMTVRPDGRVSLPMVGELPVIGLTSSELERTITEKLGAIIRDPHVSVSIREASSHKVYVIGEVRREGAIRMTGPMTVLQALAEAGGLNDYAKRSGIYVLRVVDGRQVRLPFNYEAVVRGQLARQNISLLPGDTVVIPR